MNFELALSSIQEGGVLYKASFDDVFEAINLLSMEPPKVETTSLTGMVFYPL